MPSTLFPLSQSSVVVAQTKTCQACQQQLYVTAKSKNVDVLTETKKTVSLYKYIYSIKYMYV